MYIIDKSDKTWRKKTPSEKWDIDSKMTGYLKMFVIFLKCDRNRQKNLCTLDVDSFSLILLCLEFIKFSMSTFLYLHLRLRL